MLVVFRFVRLTDGCDVLDGTSGRWRIAKMAAVVLCSMCCCIVFFWFINTSIVIQCNTIDCVNSNTVCIIIR